MKTVHKTQFALLNNPETFQLGAIEQRNIPNFEQYENAVK